MASGCHIGQCRYTVGFFSFFYRMHILSLKVDMEYIIFLTHIMSSPFMEYFASVLLLTESK